eukprot:scaffold4132_cov202-Prasinococcus_capsulatus_cf.AAC.1
MDKASIRWVVHWNLPASLENLYQESGRGGRDGKPCVSRVFFRYSVSLPRVDTCTLCSRPNGIATL